MSFTERLIFFFKEIDAYLGKYGHSLSFKKLDEKIDISFMSVH